MRRLAHLCHRTVLGLLVCALGLVLSACADEVPDELRVATPTASATSGSTSASPTADSSVPTPPEFPESAKGSSDEAGAAFIRYYIDMLGYAEKTGDVKPLKRLGLPMCERCSLLAKGYHDLHANGGFVQGTSRTVDMIKGGINPGENLQAEVVHYTYRVRLSHTEYVVAFSASATPTAHTAGTTTYDFTTVRYRNAWRIASWGEAP